MEKSTELIMLTIEALRTIEHHTDIQPIHTRITPKDTRKLQKGEKRQDRKTKPVALRFPATRPLCGFFKSDMIWRESSASVTKDNARSNSLCVTILQRSSIALLSVENLPVFVRDFQERTDNNDTCPRKSSLFYVTFCKTLPGEKLPARAQEKRFSFVLDGTLHDASLVKEFMAGL